MSLATCRASTSSGVGRRRDVFVELSGLGLGDVPVGQGLDDDALAATEGPS